MADKLLLVTPRGLHWGGDSPVDIAEEQSEDGYEMLVRESRLTQEMRDKWHVQGELPLSGWTD